MSLADARRPRTSAGIFTASMADVVFLLLVFFMLTYAVSPDLTRMTLPRSVVRTEVPRDAAIISIAPPADREVIRVTTGQSRSLAVSSDEEIESFVATLVASNPKQPFVIRADRGVRYERVDAVLDALKRGNATEVYLLSEQATVE